jgi:WD40 repeat protein
MPYKAFMSYSHTEHFALARALQLGLHHLAKPWYRLRTMSVYRDETDLAASPGLWSALEVALAASDFFIFMASPRAAQSPWVCKEVEWWLANRTSAKLLIVLVDGALFWDVAAGGFDRDASTALPPCLLHAFPEEPFFVDLRWITSTDLSKSTRTAAFREAVLNLGATLLSRAKSELDGEDLRQHRRTRQILVATVIVLAALSTTTALAAWVAIEQRDEAIASSLTISSESLLPTSPELSLLLAKKSFELNATEDGAFALRRALLRNPQRMLHLGTPELPVNAKFAGSGTVIIAKTSDANAENEPAAVWDSATGRLLALIPLQLSGQVQPNSSPDGARVALPADDTHFAVYDTNNWRSLAVLEGQQPMFTADGRLLVSLAGETSLRTWNARTLNVVSTVNLNGEYELFDVSPDGAIAFCDMRADPDSTTDVDAVAFSTISGARVLGIADHKFMENAVLRDHGHTVLGISPDKQQLEAWDLQHPEKPRPASGAVGPGPGYVGAINPVDGDLVIGTTDGALHFWEPDLKYRGEEQPHSDSVQALKFTPDGKTLLSAAADGTASLADLARGRSIATFGGPQDFVWGTDVAADNDHILLSHMDGTVRVWSRYTWFPTQVVGAFAQMSSDGRVLLTFAGKETQRELHDVQSGQVLATLPGDSNLPFSIALDTAKRHLAVLTRRPSSVEIWDIASARLIGTLKAPADARVVALSPDGKQLVVAGSEAGNTLWDVASQHQVRELDELAAQVTDVLFHPDGKRLFAATHLGRVTELNLDTGKARALIDAADDRPFASLSLSRDGQLLLIAGGESAEIWDLQSRSRVQSFSGHSDPVSSVALSPDSRFVVTGGGSRPNNGVVEEDHNEVILWDARSGRELTRYRGGVAGIEKLAFGATARDIIAVDLQARIYRCEVCIPDADLASLADARAARELTRAALARFHVGQGLWSHLTASHAASARAP